MSKNIIKYIDKLVNIFVWLIFIIVILYIIFSFYNTFTIYNGAKLSKEIIKYMPNLNEENYSLEGVRNVNEDICGWIIIQNTNVNYPIVQGKDNLEYLNKNYEKDYAVTGSIFLDYRNSFNFTDNYSVIYGHNMKGNLMFSDIKAFAQESYFNEHLEGNLYTLDKNYKLDIFAYADVSAYSTTIYNIDKYKAENTQELLEYAKKYATVYKDISVTDQDKIILLSTCNSNGSTSRSVLIAKLEEISQDVDVEKTETENKNEVIIENENQEIQTSKGVNKEIFKWLFIILIVIILLILRIFVFTKNKGKHAK